ncbi:MAG: tRNA epoxyqueuosine(34) reductase QueG [Chloroflexota bacterium]
MTLEQAIKEEARRLGFVLAGVAAPEPPAHLSTYQRWLEAGRHADMGYLASDQARARRADPRLLLPECKSILVLAIPYHPPPIFAPHASPKNPDHVAKMGGPEGGQGRVAAYAWGEDYHLVIPPKLQSLAAFIEAQVGHPVPHRAYTDTGPLLERDLAQRAGLGWIGKNTCLIHPKFGSFFFLAEILLGLELQPGLPFQADHCGACTRCMQACPTQCILPDRTLDARRCLSYLTIENKGPIPPDLRPKLGDWIFGCDICQTVCPWNRFAPGDVDASFAPRPALSPKGASTQPGLISALSLSPADFNRDFQDSPVKRAKRRGYLRNVAVALGNVGGPEAAPALRSALDDPEPLVREHAAWALTQIEEKQRPAKTLS